jgi:hypothetical protein
VLSLLTKIEYEERQRKSDISNSPTPETRAQAAKAYSIFNQAMQGQLKKLMSDHKKELDEFIFHHHF